MKKHVCFGTPRDLLNASVASNPSASAIRFEPFTWWFGKYYLRADAECEAGRVGLSLTGPLCLCLTCRQGRPPLQLLFNTTILKSDRPPGMT